MPRPAPRTLPRLAALALAAAGLFALPDRVAAQAAPGSVPGSPALGSGGALAPGGLPSTPSPASTFSREQPRTLPAGPSIWSLLETADAFVIADRVGGPGLYLGEPELFGSRGGSWTQSAFRMDGLDFTDPARAGTPLLHADPGVFDSISVGSSLPPVDVGGGGSTLHLVPRPPAGTLGGRAEAGLMPHAWQAAGAGAVPPVARLESGGHGSVLVSGPVAPGFGLLGSARYAASRRVERADPNPLDSRLASAFVHAVASRSPAGRVRVLASADRARYPHPARARFPFPKPVQRDAYGEVHAVWERAPASGLLTTVSAGYQRAGTAGPRSSGDPVVGVIERLLDGPVPELVSSAAGARGRWQLAASLQAPAFDLGVGHDVHAGVSLSRSWSAPAAQPRALVGEMVDGLPARLWDYAPVASGPLRESLDAALWVNDSLRLRPSVTFDLGVRAELTHASAREAANRVEWRSLLPRGLLRWQVTSGLSAFAGYGYSQYRLPLAYLAYGDAGAAAARVYRWTDPDGNGLASETEAGRLVRTAGPGNAPFFPSRIDPGLEPPVSREFLLGFEARFARHWAFRVSGHERRDDRLVAPVNEGVTAEDYVVRELPDQGDDFLNPADDRVLRVYDRQPASFGRDAAVLTNAPGHDVHDIGVDVALERVFDGRWHMLFGARAHRSDGLGANRGFRANENDPGVLGEAFLDPNAMTYTRGRLFLERGYVIKWSAGLVAGKGFSAGTVARYQDGQHFSRLVVVPDLAQGPEAIQAYTRGHSRFTFTFTLDARLEQAVPVPGGRLAFVLDAFNLLNTRNEVEEDAVTTRAFRASTALQPPRTLRLGMRYQF